MFQKPYFNKLNLGYLSYKGEKLKRIAYKNINKDGFIVQGLCITENYYLLSSYYKKKDDGIKEKSRIYFYNKQTLVCDGYVVLDNYSHVGGITYDNINDVLFVTGSYGKINAYKYSGIVKCLNGIDNVLMNKIDSDKLDISLCLDNNVSAATIYYFNSCLYVATCSEKGSLVRYEIEYLSDYNRIIVNNVFIYKDLPACIQGLVVFLYKDEEFFLISQSYGRLRSCIKLFSFDDLKFLGQKVISSSGIEGIDISSLGDVYSIFENSDDVSRIFHISSIKSKINSSLEKKYIEKGAQHQVKLDKLIEKK